MTPLNIGFINRFIASDRDSLQAELPVDIFLDLSDQTRDTLAPVPGR